MRFRNPGKPLQGRIHYGRAGSWRLAETGYCRWVGLTVSLSLCIVSAEGSPKAGHTGQPKEHSLVLLFLQAITSSKPRLLSPLAHGMLFLFLEYVRSQNLHAIYTSLGTCFLDRRDVRVNA